MQSKWEAGLLSRVRVEGADNCSGLSSLLAKQAEDYRWTMKDVTEMFGGEADRVLVVGSGELDLEAISRARLTLGILLCCHDEDTRKSYNYLAPAYRAAIEQGLVEVTIPHWHPKVIELCFFENSFHPL